MAETKIYIIVLAAGQGKRMGTNTPKVLHKLANLPMLAYSLENIRSLALRQQSIAGGIAGDGAATVQPVLVVSEKVRKHADFQELLSHYSDLSPSCVVQTIQRGTGDALQLALASLDGGAAAADPAAVVLVLYGDAPLLESDDLATLVEAAQASKLVATGFIASDPAGYGRIDLDKDGAVLAVIEDRECTAQQRDIQLCNGGILAGQLGFLRELLDLGLSPALNADAAAPTDAANPTTSSLIREIYLTDIFAAAADQQHPAACLIFPAEKLLGVNTIEQLAAVESIIQQRLRLRLQAAGVKLLLPESIFLSYDTAVGPGTTIHPHVVLGLGVRIGECCEIFAHSVLSHCAVGDGSRIGPFALLREGTVIGTGCRIGSFVETKKAELASGVKAPHLSYLGDVVIGAETNVGAGTVFCNYDGHNKHQTLVGERSFIGANSSIIAPRSIGAGARIAAGSVVVTDVPAGNLAIARSRQVNKPGGGCGATAYPDGGRMFDDLTAIAGLSLDSHRVSSHSEEGDEGDSSIISRNSSRVGSNSWPLDFVKMHGLGNDILVLDLDHNRLSLAGTPPSTSTSALPRLVLNRADLVLLADRHFGIGCDQMMLVRNITQDGAEVIIYNNDGSEALACGNGMRCLGLWMFLQQRQQRSPFTAPLSADRTVPVTTSPAPSTSDPGSDGYTFFWQLKNRTIRTTLYGIQQQRYGIVGEVLAELGEYRSRTVILELPLKPRYVYHVSLANEHLVIIVDSESECDLGLAESLAAGNILFPDGVNVSFVALLSDDTIVIRTWERGVKQPTISCGSASAACHIAVFEAGLARNRRMKVLNVGGELLSILDDSGVSICGPATLVYSGRFFLGVLDDDAESAAQLDASANVVSIASEINEAIVLNAGVAADIASGAAANTANVPNGADAASGASRTNGANAANVANFISE